MKIQRDEQNFDWSFSIQEIPFGDVDLSLKSLGNR